MRRLLKKRVFLVLVIALLAVMFWRSDWMGRWMYPVQYKEDIRISAKNYGVEPQLIAAIIRAESNYQTGKVSKKGALGIMQVMPDTAEWIVEQGKFTGVTMDKLHNRADIGIELGSWYLQKLNQQFKNNKIAVIAAYNAGPGTVKRWLSEGQWDGKQDTVSNIPYGETRHYIQKVIYYYNKYMDLYPDFDT
ncbi:lytic transglycosylase domain-containing protein [Paenibacillus sp. GCM10027626]|uniref:lytic transglycosylase domain-containing protein n=1 Tax=Paenibacillus sp. GCM10027626 TaxID=3273411 RepID=UPI003637F4E9